LKVKYHAKNDVIGEGEKNTKGGLSCVGFFKKKIYVFIKNSSWSD